MTAIWIRKEKDARDTPGLLAKSMAQNLPPKINEFIMQGKFGTIQVPTGPGLGVIIDPDFIKKHKIVKA